MSKPRSSPAANPSRSAGFSRSMPSRISISSRSASAAGDPRGRGLNRHAARAHLRDFEAVGAQLLADVLENHELPRISSTIIGTSSRCPPSCPSRRARKCCSNSTRSCATCWSMIQSPSLFTATMKLLFTCPSGFSSAISPGSRQRSRRDAGSASLEMPRRALRQNSSCSEAENRCVPMPLRIWRRCAIGRSRRAGQFEIARDAAPCRRSRWESRRAAARSNAPEHGARQAAVSGSRAGSRSRGRAADCAGLGRRCSRARGRETRNRPRARKRLPDRIAREVVHKLRMPEAHLDLRRVHVHVHFLVRQIEKQQHRRETRRAARCCDTLRESRAGSTGRAPAAGSRKCKFRCGCCAALRDAKQIRVTRIVAACSSGSISVR